MSRKYTNRLIELVEAGLISEKAIFNELMSYLSEDGVKEFCLEGFGGEIAGEFKNLEVEE